VELSPGVGRAPDGEGNTNCSATKTKAAHREEAELRRLGRIGGGVVRQEIKWHGLQVYAASIQAYEWCDLGEFFCTEELALRAQRSG